ncbi:MAG: hypothetical protein WEB60_05815 [Terrimicrobiaceae bacterium]
MLKRNNIKQEALVLAVACIVMALKIGIGIFLFQNWRAREAAAGRFVSRDSEME